MSQVNTHRVRLQVIETLGSAEMTIQELHELMVSNGYTGNGKSINSALRLMVHLGVARIAGHRGAAQSNVYALVPAKPEPSVTFIIPTVKLDPMAWIVATSGADVGVPA